MAEAEFDLIRRYFMRPEKSSRQAPDTGVICGIGDDGAVVRPASGHDLVISTDTLVSGVHFPEDASAAAIGHKALAVNLSDLAAMGATPRWATLALTLPAVDDEWLKQFSVAFFKLADEYNLQLIGGDTTQGPLAITVTVHGEVPQGMQLTRSGANPGDHIYVTGCLGDAALALSILKKTGKRQAAALFERLDYPQPRVTAGLQLREFATAAIDISDGLLADLGNILTASGVGAQINIDEVPRSPAFNVFASENSGSFDYPGLVLAGGDDYELCFTAPANRCGGIKQQFESTGLPITRIGEIEATAGLRCVSAAGDAYHPSNTGFEHFRSDLTS